MRCEPDSTQQVESIIKRLQAHLGDLSMQLEMVFKNRDMKARANDEKDQAHEAASEKLQHVMTELEAVQLGCRCSQIGVAEANKCICDMEACLVAQLPPTAY